MWVSIAGATITGQRAASTVVATRSSAKPCARRAMACAVAGAITTWLAFSTSDGLVVDDYYRQGLAINQSLARVEAARRMGVAAHVELGDDSSRISIMLDGPSAPQSLEVQFLHATRSGQDLRLRLARTGERRYEAAFRPLAEGHWRLRIDDPGRVWSIAGEWARGAHAGTLGGS